MEFRTAFFSNKWKYLCAWFVLGVPGWWHFTALALSIGSKKWLLASLILGVGILAGGIFLLRADRYSAWVVWRSRGRKVGLLLWGGGVAAYILIFQYTDWSVIFSDPWIRMMIWAWIILWGSFWWTADEQWIGIRAFVTVTLLSGAMLVMAKAFSWVTDYPFWLGWSEGNRMWDFSVLFGRRLYNYPIDQPITAMIDVGRQLMWGAIFLLPHPTIVQVRFWNALMFTLPLVVFGWVLFRRVSKTRAWWLAGIWVFVFLYQGPIYSQLVVAATLVALAWQRPFRLSVPLVLVAGYFAHISRWTWMFAPAIWIVMLEVARAELDESGRLPRDVWRRAIVLGGAGLLGGYVLPVLQKRLAAANAGGVDLSEAVAYVGHQPLLWYRLLPNPTYRPGILLGLLGVILPLVLWLLWQRKTGWRLNLWQLLVVSGGLAAFLVVGLVASTKIGGGSNLHNLDMFLVGLVFVTALAWRSNGEKQVTQALRTGWLGQVLLFALVLQPVWRAPLQMFPLRYDAEHVQRYLPAGAPLPQNLPEEEYIPLALQIINDQVAAADGEILFMDHRQLLTFGYVPQVPLVPEYEKKILMNEAMGNNARYFLPYYQDLEAQRFSLIVTEPLIWRYQRPGGEGFAEENNAWVRWVVEPTLCYYRPIATLERVHVQLLVPRGNPEICQPYLDAVRTQLVP